MHKPFLLLAVAGVLFGCASKPPEPSMAEQHDKYCRSIGVAPGTQAYADCRLRVLQTHVQALSAQEQANAIRSTTESAPVLQGTYGGYTGYGMPTLR
jgi:hypothetical protein